MPDRAFIDQLATVWSSIAGLCADFTAEQWALPTDCPGWSVQDNVAHIEGTESWLLGRPGPDPAPAGLAHVQNAIGEINEAWVESRRRWPGDKVLAAFVEVTDARIKALRAMTDEELDAPSVSPIGEVPYATFMNLRVMDCWVHEQDIRRAVGRPGHLEGEAVDAAIDRLAASFPFVVGKRVAPPDGTTVVLDMAGPAGRTLAVEVRGGRAVPAQPVPAAPTVRLDTDAETYACLVCGRWTGEQAQARGRVRVSGDSTLGEEILAHMATIP
jgi:uncharacterized protein (TIGR03083 family)